MVDGDRGRATAALMFNRSLSSVQLQPYLSGGLSAPPDIWNKFSAGLSLPRLMATVAHHP